MSDLISQTAFNGFDKDFEGLSIKEISAFEIVSLAVAKGQSKSFLAAFKKQFGRTLPQPGHWAEIENGKILWTGQGHYFLFLDGEDERCDETLQPGFQDNAYLTLQTDGWAALEITGPKIHDVLERFIPLDLRAWKIKQGTRTSAHHMGVFVMKTGDESYQVLTPVSSSATLLEALIHVIENVLQSG